MSEWGFRREEYRNTFFLISHKLSWYTDQKKPTASDESFITSVGFLSWPFGPAPVKLHMWLGLIQPSTPLERASLFFIFCSFCFAPWRYHNWSLTFSWENPIRPKWKYTNLFLSFCELRSKDSSKSTFLFVSLRPRALAWGHLYSSVVRIKSAVVSYMSPDNRVGQTDSHSRPPIKFQLDFLSGNTLLFQPLPLSPDCKHNQML